FCAVSRGTISPATLTDNAAATSPDGITWTLRTLPSTVPWKGIAWNGTTFCAVAGGTTFGGTLSNAAATSTDGITWAAQTLPATTDWTCIAAGGSLFCAVARNASGGANATSTDGVTWTLRGLDQYYWDAIAWNGTLFLVVGESSTWRTSPDGITWTSIDAVAGNFWMSVASNGYDFCVLSTTVGGSPKNVAMSAHRINDVTFTWQRRSRLNVRMIGPLGINVPLGETTESYELDVYSNGTYATKLRTLASSTPTVLYSANLQTADGLTPGNPVYVKVYQLSSVVGRGYPLTGVA
ncbi:MAG TPA: hypothetical protein VIY48_00785, partial [Candidatus Paceibacterota bacterium]